MMPFTRASGSGVGMEPINGMTLLGMDWTSSMRNSWRIIFVDRCLAITIANPMLLCFIWKGFWKGF